MAAARCPPCNVLYLPPSPDGERWRTIGTIETRVRWPGLATVAWASTARRFPGAERTPIRPSRVSFSFSIVKPTRLIFPGRRGRLMRSAFQRRSTAQVAPRIPRHFTRTLPCRLTRAVEAGTTPQTRVPLHAPPPHTSLSVQASPSSHEVPSAPAAEKVQPVAGSQASAVHGLPSSHATAVPPWHTPAEHVPAVVQALPSLHGCPSGSRRQLAEQQSPSTPLPSSHSSPGSMLPLPQRRSCRATTVLPPDAWDCRHTTITSPVPAMLTAGLASWMLGSVVSLTGNDGPCRRPSLQKRWPWMRPSCCQTRRKLLAASAATAGSRTVLVVGVSSSKALPSTICPPA